MMGFLPKKRGEVENALVYSFIRVFVKVLEGIRRDEAHSMSWIRSKIGEMAMAYLWL
jgi:hypothetical protein